MPRSAIRASGGPRSSPTQGPEGSVVDESLLDLLRTLTPEERLHWNDRMAATVLELRHGFSVAAEADDAPRAPGRERD